MNPWVLSFSGWIFILRAAVVYLFIIVLLRVGGKRQIGQMGVGEFVAILLISNAVQNSMNGGDNSITGGLILATVIIGISRLLEYITYKSKKLENLIQGRPTLLVHNGQILHKALERELLNERELRALLRRQGIQRVNEVENAILESDGYISITKKAELENSNQHSA